MNDQDKLYLELNAKDNVSSIIEKITKDSEKLQQNFDNFKKITIKDIALKADGALSAIKKQIQDSLNAEPFTINVAPDIDTARVTEAARAIIEAQDKIVNAANKGVTVEAILNAPLKDPIKYRIMNFEVSLRRSDADKVEIVTLDEAQRDRKPEARAARRARAHFIDAEKALENVLLLVLGNAYARVGNAHRHLSAAA